MRWHHYAGLIFGVVTTTWIFSGLLSMDPWDWHPSTAPTRDQRARVAGGSIDAADLSLERLRKAIDAFAPEHPKEIEITRFRGHYYATRERAASCRSTSRSSAPAISWLPIRSSAPPAWP